MPINDKKMYPLYAKCVELGIPIFCCAGIPGPRLKAACQHVELIDEVMYDFPDLVFVTRHGCEPWTELAVKLMLKWPGLHYSTSAFAPKYYPKNIVDYANTRGADKVIYAGYFPMGLSIERIMTEMRDVGFKDEVWPKFLRTNALRVLGLDGCSTADDRPTTASSTPTTTTTRPRTPSRATSTRRWPSAPCSGPRSAGSSACSSVAGSTGSSPTRSSTRWPSREASTSTSGGETPTPRTCVRCSGTSSRFVPSTATATPAWP